MPSDRDDKFLEILLDAILYMCDQANEPLSSSHRAREQIGMYAVSP